MKVAAFQMSAEGDPDDRLSRVMAAMEDAARNGAEMLVTPELALSGYGRGNDLQTLAQHADGPWITQLQDKVRELQISLVVGFPERDGNHCFISAAVISKDDASGPLIYRKGQLYGDYEKEHFQSPGPSCVLTSIGGLKLGFLICYDIEFPEHVRRLAQAGADAIIVPTALPKGASAEFIATHMIRVRAFENQVFVVYADHADADDRFEYQGLSSIVAPDGSKLASAPLTGSTLLYADLDMRAYSESRNDNPYLTDLRI
ncbi:MAG: carbon-nitrogen hydrolase family protein [Paracoccaceae bacterium]